MVFLGETITAARCLESYLCQSLTRIENSYLESWNGSRDTVGTALATDHAMVNRIQSSTLNLMNQVMILQDYLDEPATLKPESIQSLKSVIDACCTIITDFLGRMRLELQSEISRQKSIEDSNGVSLIDAKNLEAQRPPSLDPPHLMNSLGQVGNSILKIEQPRSPRNPTQSNAEIGSRSGYLPHHRKTLSIPSSQSEERRFSIVSGVSGISESPMTEQMQPMPLQPMIPREDIQRRVMENETFLARRHKSKVEFHEELRALSATWSSGPSSDGEGSGDVLALASTLKLPDFGKNVADGIEAIKRESHNTDVPDGLMPVSQANGPTPATSILSGYCTMSPDSSFYGYGGFCEGAKMAWQGQKSYKVIKRPEGSRYNSAYEEIDEDAPAVQYVGAYMAVVTARCRKCSYEVDWTTFKKDRLRGQSAFHCYEDFGVRYRQSFLSKSHLKVKSMQDTIFACVFCVDDNKTVEIHDATVFFSPNQLIRHIAMRHRPVLREIHGIKVSYGVGDQEFDLSFSSDKVTLDSLSEASTDISSFPTAQAIQAHRPKSGYKYSPQDPNGNPTLQFAIGAQIAGVTFPIQFHGQWCLGYHDCSKGLFPSDTIRLKPPSTNDFTMNSTSSLCATARWDHNTKGTSSDWLTFSRKEKITQIGFPYEDFWCWSGRNRKGKFGLFPKEFVVVDENFTGDGGKMASGGGEGRMQRSRLLGGVLSSFQNNTGIKVNTGKGRRESKR